MKIEPFVLYYKRLITSHNNTAHNILEKEIYLMLHQIQKKQKCGIITTLVSSFIRLAYEGISSFQHHKQNKALHQAARDMYSKTTFTTWKHWKSQLALCLIYTTQHLCMRDYLQDSKAL